MTERHIPFEAEKKISSAFSISQCVKNGLDYGDWHAWEASEVKGLFGIPDHIVVLWRKDNRGRLTIRTVALEVKLVKWQRALIQAYRYAAFADYSLVVLDRAFVHRALASLDDFKRANIGLLSVDRQGHVEWHHRPRYQRPYSEINRRSLNTAIKEHVFGNTDARSGGGSTIKWSAGTTRKNEGLRNTKNAGTKYAVKS